MDDPVESKAYDEMDHSEVNVCFVKDFLAAESKLHDENILDVLDLGTGTARIPIELCRATPHCRIMASDAALSMLDIARLNVSQEGLEDRIQLHHGDAKSLGFEDGYFGAVISNSLIHHIRDPLPVVREMLRVTRPGGLLFVRDLMRPATLRKVEKLVMTYAKNEPAESQQLFRQSLIAALTLPEIQDLLGSLGIGKETVSATTDRHWTWCFRRPISP